MLIKKQNSPEVSYVDPKGIRHPLTAKAWSEYHSAARPMEVSQSEYDHYPRGTAHYYSGTFGGTEDATVEPTDLEIWQAESSDEVIQ